MGFRLYMAAGAAADQAALVREQRAGHLVVDPEELAVDAAPVVAALPWLHLHGLDLKRGRKKAFLRKGRKQARERERSKRWWCVVP